jgi:hypothetical protein
VIVNPPSLYASDEYRARPDAGTISPATDGGVWTFELGAVSLSSGWAYDVVSGAAFRVTRETGHVDLMTSLSIYYGFDGKPTLILRSNSAGTARMQCVLDTDGKLYIEKVVAGTVTRLTGSSAVVGAANATAGAFQFEANGSTYTAYWNGTSVFSLTDTSITAGTRAGYAFAANGAVRVNQWQANRVELLARVATQVVVRRQPTLVAQTAVVDPTPPIFAVADSNGDVMTSVSGTMTLTLVDDTGSGTSLGTLTKSIVSGIADFTGLGLGVTGVGTNHWHASNGTVAGDTAVFTVQSGAVTAEQVLVAQLGGNASVTGFYDLRTNVGLTGSLLNTIDDVRGTSGYGPQLVATAVTGSKPLYDSTGKTVEMNQSGSTNFLASAAFAGFDPSATERTLIYIGTAESGQSIIAQLADLANTKYLGVEVNGTAVRVRASPSGPFSLPPAPSTTRRLWAVEAPVYASGAGNAPVVGHAAGRAIRTAAMSAAFAAGSWSLVLGGSSSSASSPVYSHAIVRAVLVIDHRLTGAEWDALQSYATAQHVAVMDETISTVMYDGNSIMAGHLATAEAYNIAGRVLTALPGHEYGNNGVSGQTGATIVAHQWARTLPAFDAAHPKNVAVYWGEGFNELATDIGGYTAYRHMVDACLAAKARGFTVLVATVLNATSLTGVRETARLLQNSLTRANYHTFADALADVAQVTAMQTPSDTSLYPDGLHPSDAGYAYLANDATYGFIANITPLLTTTAAYTLALAAGSYSITGRAGGLLAQRRLPLTVGSYAITGNPAGLTTARRLALVAGSYAVTGSPAGLRRGLWLALASGGYTIAGSATGLLRGFRLTLSAGAYTIAGAPVGFRRALRLAMSAGAYVITGAATGLIKSGSYVFTLASGVYTMTGRAVGMVAARRFPLASGSYTIAGAAVGLNKLGSYVLSLASGAYSLTGRAIGLLAGRRLPLAPGIYRVTGTTIGLYQGSSTRALTILASVSQVSAPVSVSVVSAPVSVTVLTPSVALSLVTS